MTTELQRAMARYEDARIAYKKAVLSSLNGDSSGESIRQAITEFQNASAELTRIRGVPSMPRNVAARPTAPVVVNRVKVRRTVVSPNGVMAWKARVAAAFGRIQLPSLGFALRRLISAE